jgi:predicted bacteriocin transport accessory protein
LSKKFWSNIFLALGVFLAFAGVATISVSADSSATIESNTSSKIIDGATYEENIRGVIPITLTQYLHKAQTGEKFIVFVGFKECVHCRKFSPVMKQYLQQSQHPIYYLDYGNNGSFSMASQKQITDFYSTFATPMSFMGTPTVALLDNGKVVSMTAGDDTTLSDLQQITADYNNQ